MFIITVTLDGIDEFINQNGGGAGRNTAERDRFLAEKNPSMAHLWYGGETYGRLWLQSNDVSIEVRMLGPTVVLDQMLKARSAVTAGDDSFQMTFHGGYGVGLRVDVDGEVVTATCTARTGRVQPESVETSVEEFVAAVDAYEAWYHTEYLAIASWLLLVEDVQQMRRHAGYPADRL